MKVLALVDAPDHVCCRYRILAFEPALARNAIPLRVEAIAKGLFQRVAQFRSTLTSDLVLLQRKLLPRWQLQLLRRHARRLVFDFDDAVLYRDSYDARGLLSSRRAKRFSLTVRLADVVIAGNDFLADCALRAGANPEKVRVIPTCIPTDRYPPAKSGGNESLESLELVWVGSSSTLKGLEQSRSIWDRIGREVENVRLRVICDRFPDLGRMPIVPVRWDESSEISELAKGDVGVSWIPDDPWSRGKCGLKLLQYGAAGLPSLANPVGVHPEIIQSGATGFLPETADEWVAAVKTLANAPALRCRMGMNARRAIESGYSVGAWESAFVTSVAGAATHDELFHPRQRYRPNSIMGKFDQRGPSRRRLASEVRGGES